MNARRTPKQVFNAHLPDQRLQIRTYLGSASQALRFAMPVAPKTGTMPAYHGFGPDDRDGLENRRKPAIQLDEEQPVAVRQLDATAHLALQYHYLMAKSGVLRFKSALWREERGKQVQDEEYQRDHRGRR